MWYSKVVAYKPHLKSLGVDPHLFLISIQESVSQDTDMLTEEPSICVSCPERLDFANVRIPSLSDISVASI